MLRTTVWQATRARVATEGFGARLLALQDPDGQWAGGAFFPKDFDFNGHEAAEGAREADQRPVPNVAEKHGISNQ